MIGPALLAVTLLAAAPGKPVKDEFQYLFSRYDTDGLAPASTPGDGNFSGNVDSFDPGGLPSGGKYSDRRMTVESPLFGSVGFLRPRTAGKEKNFLSCKGQKIPILTTKIFNVLFFLGMAHGGSPSGWLDFHFADGSKARAPFGLTDWREEALFGEELACKLKYNPPGGKGGGKEQGHVWLQRVPVPRKKRIQAIVLPSLPGAKILAFTLGYRVGVQPIVRTSSSPASSPAPEPATVAIFQEKGFPRYNAAYAIRPEELKKALEGAGIQAALLSVEHLSDTDQFTTERFPLLVNLYGEAFPVEAIAALRQHRSAGGAMVHTSVPFGRIYKRSAYGSWTLQAPPKEGLGCGSPRKELTAPLEPGEKLTSLGLGGLPWSEFEILGDLLQLEGESRRGLSPRSVSAHEVVPLVTFKNSESYFAALIKHRSGDFSGAIDVWAGTSAFSPPDGRFSSSFEAQLLVRLVAFALYRKGILAKEKFAELTGTLSGEAMRQPLPSLVEPAEASLEAVEKVEKITEIYRASLSELSVGEKVLLSSGQGLVNGRGEKFLCLVDSAEDSALLTALKEKGQVETVKAVGFKEALALVGHRRAVLVDTAFYGSLNLATMVAGLEDLLIAYPGVVAKHRLEVALDLHGLFDDGEEMLGWTYENIWPRLGRDLLCMYPPDPESYHLRDLLVSRKVFTFWFPTWRTPSARRSIPSGEFAILERILAETSVLTPVIGDLVDGEGRGLGPELGARAMSRFGKRLVPLDVSSPTQGSGCPANLSFASRLRFGDSMPETSAPRELDLANKIYIAILRHPLAFLPGRRSGPPVEFSGALAIAPRGVVLRPAYEPWFPVLSAAGRAVVRPEDCLGMALPKAVRLGEFGKAYGDSSSAEAALVDLLGREVKKRGLQFLHASYQSLEGSDVLEKGLPGFSAGTPIFVSDSGKRAATHGPMGAHDMRGETPVFYDMGPEEFTRTLTGKVIPATLPLFLSIGEETLKSVAGDINFAENNVVFVRPDELVLLYREVRKSKTPARRQLLAAGSTWKYHDGGEDLGTGWRLPDYDDKDWKEGAALLGYGDDYMTTTLSFGGDPENTHSCYYFRKTLELESTRGVALLHLEYLIDDGCVVYLNGKEINRHNIREGEVTYATWAKPGVGAPEESQWYSSTASAADLRPGKNTIAVEVHQVEPSSSDLAFDLKIFCSGWLSVERTP